MMAKAVAHHTTAAFIRVVGSEFVQKYLGEGPRMVRDVFRMAKENAPAIVFIDEVDAIATKRFDAQTGADREVQRILLELLNQMDGFDQTVNVKVIMATNRQDTLDPALLRPGRLDRKIEFPNPDRRQKRLIFQVRLFLTTQHFLRLRFSPSPFAHPRSAFFCSLSLSLSLALALSLSVCLSGVHREDESE